MADQQLQSQANVYLANTLTVLWYICWPIGILVYYVAIAVLSILKLLYRPVRFLLQPFVYLGRFVLACMIAPFQLLVKFETVYIYLGIAAIVGLIVGLVVSFAYGSLSSFLRLDSEPEASQSGRTAKEYRETKRKRRTEAEAPLISTGPLSPDSVSTSQMARGYIGMSDGTRKGKHGKGLLDQTIMEEVDSDY